MSTNLLLSQYRQLEVFQAKEMPEIEITSPHFYGNLMQLSAPLAHNYEGALLSVKNDNTQTPYWASVVGFQDGGSLLVDDPFIKQYMPDNNTVFTLTPGPLHTAQLFFQQATAVDPENSNAKHFLNVGCKNGATTIRAGMNVQSRGGVQAVRNDYKFIWTAGSRVTINKTSDSDSVLDTIEASRFHQQLLFQIRRFMIENSNFFIGQGKINYEPGLLTMDGVETPLRGGMFSFAARQG